MRKKNILRYFKTNDCYFTDKKVIWKTEVLMKFIGLRQGYPPDSRPVQYFHAKVSILCDPLTNQIPSPHLIF